MWIVAIAWMYVALMMALAEATSPQGTVLGAIITFFFYGVGPLALVMYLLGAPARRKALRQKEMEARARIMAEQMLAQRPPADAAADAASSTQADGSRLPPGAGIPPVGEEPKRL